MGLETKPSAKRRKREEREPSRRGGMSRSGEEERPGGDEERAREEEDEETGDFLEKVEFEKAVNYKCRKNHYPQENNSRVTKQLKPWCINTSTTSE